MFVYYVPDVPKGVAGNVFTFDGSTVREIWHENDVRSTLAGLGQAAPEPISYAQHQTWVKGSK